MGLANNNSEFLRSSTTTYWLDEDDIITDVSTDSWDRFASSNDGEAVLSHRVIGRRLQDFIRGDATRVWVDTLLNYSRTLDEPVEREYRCDSPDTKRFMRMEITPLNRRKLRVDHTLVQLETLEPRLSFKDALGARARGQRCSVCNRVRVHGEWREPENAGLDADQQDGFPVIYTVCGNCRHGLPLREAVRNGGS